MKKQTIITIFVSILLITSFASSVTGIIEINHICNIKLDDLSNLDKPIIKNGINSIEEWFEQDKLISFDGQETDEFSNSVSISGDYVIIGAKNDDDNGGDSGSAYIFKRNGTTWIEQAKLLSSDGESGEYFGFSVSIDDEYAIIGTRNDDDNGEDSGSAYIFKRNGTTWVEQAKLLASDGQINDEFGFSVSIDGEYAIIGAWSDDDNGDSSGSAYIFKRNGTTWTEEAKLLALDGYSYDHFGCSVSIDGEYALIGARWDDDNGDKSGSAYIFKRNGVNWNQKIKLISSDGAPFDLFGWSVSIDGEYAIIGALGDVDYGVSYGSAYIFKGSDTNWTQHAKLTSSDSALEDWFGVSVSIDGEYAIIGAYNDDDNGDNSGSAYVFKRNGTIWIQQTKIIPSDGDEDDWFGFSVSICGDYAIIGAIGDSDNGFYSGSAYVFIKDESHEPNPDLDCSGNLDWTEVLPGVTVYGSITIENIGVPDSLLNWKIESFPDWGNWSFNSYSGFNLLAGDSVDVDVEVIAPNEQEQTFTGEIVLVNLDDPSDTCSIAVSLTTPVIYLNNIYLVLQNLFERFPRSFSILRLLPGL